MKLFDVNLLVYAHREDAPNHLQYRELLEHEINSGEPFALATIVLSGFLRIVTHPRIFDPPSPLKEAILFANQVSQHPNAVFLKSSEKQWSVFLKICERAHAKGNLIPDAFIASLAIDSGCTLMTTDGDFMRFPGLRWLHPLDEGTGKA